MADPNNPALAASTPGAAPAAAPGGPAGVDPGAAAAVALGGEHPGALIDDQTLQQGVAEATQLAQQAAEAKRKLDQSPAAQLLRFTHTTIQGPRGTLRIPKADISADLSEEQLSKLSKQVIEGYEFDKRSRSEWEQRSQAAMDLALQITENKTWPWQNAANVKLPLITSAAIQFHARAYPAIVPGQQIVKGVPQGKDPNGVKMERADRVGKHLSYQALEEIPDWEEQTDKLLLNLAIVGTCFRKTYFDHTVGADRSDMVPAKHLVVNHRTKSLIDARRVSEEIFLYENDIEERIRSKRFRDVELKLRSFTEDDDPAHEFIEQHTWYDLDGDGYREPYICTVHKESEEVVRVTARFEAEGVLIDDEGNIVKITPEHYYTKFSLIPNPDGGFYDIGLGWLLNPLSESADTIMNQLLDAGTLANLGGGFIGQGLRLRAGPIRIAPGEYIPVDAKGAAIKESLVPLTFPGPSEVLFKLLGLLIDQVKEVASVKDILSGTDVPANQPATTTLALIDQGLKVFTAIYKRVHRSLKQEFKKLYRLNSLFLDPEVYFRFQDVPIGILQADYQANDLDIVPITDPTVVAGPIKLIKAQALLALKDDPRVDGKEILRRYLEALEEPAIEKLIPPEGPMQQMQMMMALKTMGEQLQKLIAENQEIYSKIDKNIGATIESLFKAGVLGPQAIAAGAAAGAAGAAASASGKPAAEPAQPGAINEPAAPAAAAAPPGPAAPAPAAEAAPGGEPPASAA